MMNTIFGIAYVVISAAMLICTVKTDRKREKRLFISNLALTMTNLSLALMWFERINLAVK